MKFFCLPFFLGFLEPNGEVTLINFIILVFLGENMRIGHACELEIT